VGLASVSLRALYEPTMYFSLSLTFSQPRIQFVIDMPGSFTGDEGAWKGGVDRDNSCFFLKYKVDDIFLDPHHITSYLSEQHGRMFASDSAYCTEFEENNDFKEKWCTFRYALPFKCFDDFSQDMGHPGLIFLTMNEVNLIIVERLRKSQTSLSF